MTHCTRCAADVHPYGDMQTDGRVVDCCPKCNGAVGTARALQVAAAVEAVTVDRVAKATRQIEAMLATPEAALRARLAAVEAQMPTPEQMKALRREYRQLRAALRALGADLDPKPN